MGFEFRSLHICSPFCSGHFGDGGGLETVCPCWL
jgi:hypothetical protein